MFDIFVTYIFQVYGRALKIAAVLGGFIGALLKDYTLGDLEKKQLKRAKQLRALLSDLGCATAVCAWALQTLMYAPCNDVNATRLRVHASEVGFAVHTSSVPVVQYMHMGC